LIINPNRMKY